MTARITIIEATRPEVLSKTVRRSEDGSLHMRAGGQLVEGQASVATVTSLADLARLLGALSVGNWLPPLKRDRSRIWTPCLLREW